MHDIHAHVWDAHQHFEAALVKEADLSRGYPLDLTVTFDMNVRLKRPIKF